MATRKTNTNNSTRNTTAKKKRKSKKRKPSLKARLTTFKDRVVTIIKDARLHRVLGLSFWLLALFLTIAFVSYIFNWGIDQSNVKGSSMSFLLERGVETQNTLGRFGSFLAHLFFYKWFGIASFVLIFVAVMTGAKLLFDQTKFKLLKVFQYSFLFIILCSTILGFFFSGEESGFPFAGGFGNYVSGWLISFLGFVGTGLLLLFLLAIVLVLIFDLSFSADSLTNNALVRSFKRLNNRLKQINISDWFSSKNKKETNLKTEGIFEDNSNSGNTNSDILDVPEIAGKSSIFGSKSTKNGVADKTKKNGKTKVSKKLFAEDGVVSGTNLYDPKLDLSNYKKPELDLLDLYGRDLYEEATIQVSKTELKRNKERIVETLGNYNIEIDSIKATPGPTVTLYEIVPAPGVRISKIRNLEDDIALSLAALGIRIIAPMPGKGTVGIEVPNEKKEIVSLRGILSSDKFQNSGMDLPVALGRTISNDCFVADLAKMPHLLLAGATGQGKSVCLNCILLSLLYSKHPAELKLVLIDPKKVELSLFNMIEKHFLAALPDEEEAIVTDTKKVINTLNALCIEMDSRYDLLKKAQVRNIKGYNTKFTQRKLNPEKGHRYLPYFVLVVDEFADLMMTAGKEVEMPLARLAQLARAVGIHLVIATQRPTVNIITGTIKANFPVRVAFRVTSKIDSRTILDTGGANQLIGRGDMLVSIGPEVIRLQGAFVDTPEVEKIAEYIGKQQGYTEYFELPEYEGESSGASGNGNLEFDDLFEEAAHIIVQHQQGSTSLLQRRLKLGYNRAGRLMDQLEASGIVGPNVGSKAREVYILDAFELEEFLAKIKG